MSKSTAAVPESNVLDQERAQTRPRSKHKSKDMRQNNLAGYVFISPWLIGFFLFALIPIGMSVWLAFTNYSLNGGHFVGLDNFEPRTSDMVARSRRHSDMCSLPCLYG